MGPEIMGPEIMGTSRSKLNPRMFHKAIQINTDRGERHEDNQVPHN